MHEEYILDLTKKIEAKKPFCSFLLTGQHHALLVSENHKYASALALYPVLIFCYHSQRASFDNILARCPYVRLSVNRSLLV